MEIITSANNDKIKYARKLAADSSLRRESGRFVIEGARLCADAASCGVTVERAFITRRAFETYGGYVSAVTAVCDDVYEIDDAVASKLSDTGNPQGVFCVCVKKDNGSVTLDPHGKYLALENVQDPSNAGAICRTAEALGLSGLIVCGGCDIYSPKVLRSAMGSSLRLDIIDEPDIVSVLSRAKEAGMLTLAAVPDSAAEDIRNISFGTGCICCIGNEGNGLTQSAKSACDKAVTVPMKGRAESLNAAAAAAVIAWELVR